MHCRLNAAICGVQKATIRLFDHVFLCIRCNMLKRKKGGFDLTSPSFPSRPRGSARSCGGDVFVQHQDPTVGQLCAATFLSHILYSTVQYCTLSLVRVEVAFVLLPLPPSSFPAIQTHSLQQCRRTQSNHLRLHHPTSRSAARLDLLPPTPLPPTPQPLAVISVYPNTTIWQSASRWKTCFDPYPKVGFGNTTLRRITISL